jgi:ribonuclease Z
MFVEKARRPFLAEKAEALGVQFGPERARLVRGEAVTLADGRTIYPEEVLGDALEGTK